MLGVFAEFVDDVGTVTGVLLLAKVVLVDVLERGTVCWIGDGVNRERGFAVTAAL